MTLAIATPMTAQVMIPVMRSKRQVLDQQHQDIRQVRFKGRFMFPSDFSLEISQETWNKISYLNDIFLMISRVLPPNTPFFAPETRSDFPFLEKSPHGVLKKEKNAPLFRFFPPPQDAPLLFGTERYASSLIDASLIERPVRPPESGRVYSPGLWPVSQGF